MPNIKEAECRIQAATAMNTTADVFRPASAFLLWAESLVSSEARMDMNMAIEAAMPACDVSTERVIVALA
ncbi:hypothetical protein ACFLSZ_07235 [Candidatus Bipolaricaulota bacterium]